MRFKKHAPSVEMPPISLTSGVEEEISEDGSVRRIVIDGKMEILSGNEMTSVGTSPSFVSGTTINAYRSKQGVWSIYMHGHRMCDDDVQRLAQALVIATQVRHEQGRVQ